MPALFGGGRRASKRMTTADALGVFVIYLAVS